jgi:hypothetical protein
MEPIRRPRRTVRVDGRSSPIQAPKSLPERTQMAPEVGRKCPSRTGRSPSEAASDRPQGVPKSWRLNTSVLTRPFGRIKTDRIRDPYFGP